MSYTLKDNTLAIENTTTQKANIFLRLFAEAVVKTSTPRTPKKTGRLRADVLKQVLGLSGKIKWMKDYAIYQETKQYRNYTTPGTGPHFAEKSVKQTVNETQRIAKQAGLI